MQIVERPGANLFSVLKKAMRSGDLRTFSLQRHGKRVVHERYPGWMNWSVGAGAIACEIHSPKQEGTEWQILTAVVGRLAQRFPALVEGINIQLPAPEPEPRRKRRRR